MAVRIIHKLISDLSQVEAQKTTKFGLDGKEYLIDLTEDEDQELREFLSRFITAGIRSNSAQAGSRVTFAGQPSTPKVPASVNQTERRLYLDAVREWAKKKNIAVSAFGRIPQTVLDMFENRHALEAAAIAETAEKVNAKHAKDTHDVVVNGKVPAQAPAKSNGHKATTPKAAKRAPGTVGAEVKVSAPAFSSAETATDHPVRRTRRPGPTKKVAAAKK